ncbi:uncharacterized protein LOC119406586 [Rhipicephalus sanguineus]|uniref:uncharacterized protein LOC119406586 n=1 Tax=Rhipicephalus sanguineus TaxID=34632 RepID=UPI0018952070|nr:uncharacterized protein LOC119406586 [Rhipicephalus sanguineus]
MASEVSDFLARSCPEETQAFSVDIKDLFYSLSQEDIVRVVKKCIEEHGVVRFQNTIGTSASRFEELLVLYLRSTAVEHNGQMYVQRNGICIGSHMAPVLSDLLLAHYDGILDEKLQSAGWVQIFRYVDDFLVLFWAQPEETSCEVERILGMFRSRFPGLTFTRELPVEGKIRFLDMEIYRGLNHTCWSYAPRSKKLLLPFSSNHSKIVKRAIACGALRNALVRSCHHSIASYYGSQVQRLKESDYPESLLISLTAALLREVRSTREHIRPSLQKSKTVVIPYVHSVSHLIKRAAGRAGVHVVLSAPNKLSSLCKKANENKQVSKGCVKKRGTMSLAGVK